MYRIGDIISVKIVKIKKYGLLVVDKHNRIGLIHIDETLCHDFKELYSKFKIKQKVKAMVISDFGDKSLSLSFRTIYEMKHDINVVPKPVHFYVKHKKFWTKNNA